MELASINGFIQSLPTVIGTAHTKTYIDDFIFRLHYILTARVIFAMSISSVVLMFFDWIHCFSHSEALPSKMVNTYCWMQNTFVLPDKLTSSEEVAHQGLDNALPEDRKAYISYYQWLPLFLMFQCCCFEISHLLWSKTEHSEMANVTDKYQHPIPKTITEKSPIVEKHPMNEDKTKDCEETKELEAIANYVIRCWEDKLWSGRPVKYFLCLLLNCINSILQIYLLRRFFMVNNLSDSWMVFKHLAEDYNTRNDTLISVFPRTVKCLFKQFGTGGSVQSHDIVCFMPFNVYTEKLFAVCLFWYYVLSVLSVLSLFLWFALLVSSSIRNLLIKIPVLHMFPINAAITDWLQHVKLDVNNWFMMWLLLKNVHVIHLKKLLPLVLDKLNEKDLLSTGWRQNSSTTEKQQLLTIRKNSKNSNSALDIN